MSKTNPGGHDYVPTSHIVQCDGCEAYVTLLQDGVLRKHLDPDKPAHLSRVERICPNSATELYREVRR